MENRVVTKAQLRRLNNQAIKAGGNALSDAFFEHIPGQLRYILAERLPLDRGWHRCFVWFATDKSGNDFEWALLDVHERDISRLPATKVVGQGAA